MPLTLKMLEDYWFFFSEKAFHTQFIILKINRKSISNNEELEEIFIECFNKIVDKVNY